MVCLTIALIRNELKTCGSHVTFVSPFVESLTSYYTSILRKKKSMFVSIIDTDIVIGRHHYLFLVFVPKRWRR